MKLICSSVWFRQHDLDLFYDFGRNVIMIVNKSKHIYFVDVIYLKLCDTMKTIWYRTSVLIWIFSIGNIRFPYTLLFYDTSNSTYLSINSSFCLYISTRSLFSFKTQNELYQICDFCYVRLSNGLMWP